MNLKGILPNHFSRYIWIGILLAAAAVRILDGLKVPIFMDEVPILYNVAHFFKHKTILPTHFSYPTFFSYLIALPVMTAFFIFYILSGYALSGITDGAWVSFLFSSKLSLLVYGGRVVSLLFSLGAIYLVYRYGRKRFGLAAGLLAGFILCIDPFGGRYIAYSRYCLPDVAASFLVTLGMILCFRCLQSNGKRSLYAASVVFGLAISTKYNAGMAILPLVTAVFLKKEKGMWKTVLLAGLFALGGFAIGSPGWILAPAKFIQGYLFEARHMAAGHLGAHDYDWLWVFERVWRVKTYLLPVAVLSIGYSILKHEKEDILFLALVIPSFLYIGQFEKKSIHYFLFLYPMVALFIGRWVYAVWNRLHSHVGRTIFILICAFLFVVYPSYRTALMIRRDMMLDNRIAAEEWIDGAVPSGTHIVLDPLAFRDLIDPEESRENVEQVKNAGSPWWGEVQRFYEKRPSYHLDSIREIWDDKTSLTRSQADYIVVSYENYGRFYTNTPHQIPDESSPLHDEYLRKKDFYLHLFGEKDHPFRLVQVFDSIAGPEVKIFKNQQMVNGVVE